MTFAAAVWPSFRTFTYSDGCLNAALAALRSCELVCVILRSMHNAYPGATSSGGHPEFIRPQLNPPTTE